ncbi:MAG: hypothetical protein AAB545_00675 [Patescibacteria group bacterium]
MKYLSNIFFLLILFTFPFSVFGALTGTSVDPFSPNYVPGSAERQYNERGQSTRASSASGDQTVSPIYQQQQRASYYQQVLNRAQKRIGQRPESLGDVVNILVSLMELLIGLFLLLSMLVFFWGVVKYIYLAGLEGKTDEAKQMMMYGAIGLFVMLSLGGIIYLVQNFFSL